MIEVVNSDLAHWVFSHLCHQDPGRSWMPGGVPVALCARCVGVYVGAALAAVAILLARLRPTPLALWAHGLAILQAPVLCLGVLPDSPAVRTLSGQLFAIGAVYLLLLCPRARWCDRTMDAPRGRAAYLSAMLGSLVAVHVLAQLPWAGTSALLIWLALAGVTVLAALCAATLIAIASSQQGMNRALSTIAAQHRRYMESVASWRIHA